MSLTTEMSSLTNSIIRQVIHVNIRLPALSQEQDQQYQAMLDDLERDTETYIDMLNKQEVVVAPADPIDLRELLNQLKASITPGDNSVSPVQLFLDGLQAILTFLAEKVKPVTV